jgi:hypothetical protein
LESTAIALAAHRPTSSRRSVPTRDLAELSRALRESGIELPDEVRRDCNRYIAGKWLFDFVREHGTPDGAHAVLTLAPAVAVTCRNASLASARVMRIPDARFPRLTRDGSPWLVNADGSYESIRGGLFDAPFPGTHAAPEPGRARDELTAARVQLSHWSQVLELPLVGQIADSSGRIRGTPQERRNAPDPR